MQRPLELTYQEILARPAVEKMVTLECIDNEVAGELISNAVWKGVTLKSLIEEATPLQGSKMWRCTAPILTRTGSPLIAR